jgi:hypothetical protein
MKITGMNWMQVETNDGYTPLFAAFPCMASLRIDTLIEGPWA